MRCVRCAFENIPGQARCIRCGSILTGQGAAAEVNPPRMPVWRRPWRGMARRLRGLRLLPEKPPTGPVRRVLDTVLTAGVVGALLSVVPGLAHILKGRFKEVRLLVALWALSLALGLFLYGSAISMPLIGLAIGLHAWVAVQYGLIKEIEETGSRVVAVLIVLALLAALYWAVPRVLAPGFTGGHTTLSIPALRVREGDYLLVRRLSRPDERLARGTLVLIHPPGIRNDRLDMGINPQNLIVGQIVGLPGETVRILDGVYCVGRQRLDPDRFPVPRWLESRPLKSGILIPADSYFVSTEYTVAPFNRATISDDIIAWACIMEASGIRGRAFMRWWPLGRRGFIEQP